MSLEVKKEEFLSLLKSSDVPVVAYFFATWCGPCKVMGPEFEALALELEGLYNFVKISIDDSPELASEYSVTSVPTLIFIKDSEVVGQNIGSVTKEKIKEEMERYFT